MRKQFLLFLTVLGATFFLTSCGLGDALADGIDMTDAGNASEIEEIVNNLVTSDMQVLEVSIEKPLSAIDGFSSNFGRLYVYTLVEDDERATFIADISESEMEEFSRTSMTSFTLKNIEKKIMDISAIDYKEIAKNIAAAKEEIPEGYSYEGITNYSFKMNDDGSYLKQEFAIEITDDSEGKEYSGNEINTIYYEMNFYTDESNNLIYDEE